MKKKKLLCLCETGRDKGSDHIHIAQHFFLKGSKLNISIIFHKLKKRI